MKRGDVVVAVMAREYGKPRPALVVQADIVAGDSVIVCPFTTATDRGAFFRIPVAPTARNGLAVASTLMLDKITAVRLDRIGGRIGSIEPEHAARIDSALLLLLGLAAPR